MTQQYQYNGLSQFTNTQHQQLTPITNLQTRPYQQDSPGPSQILPPIHTQQHNPVSSYAGGPPLYRHAASAPQTPRTPIGPNTPGSNSSAGSFAQSAPQHHVAAGQPSSTFAPIMPTGYSAGQSNGMHINSTPQSANNDSPSGYYSQMPLPQMANPPYGNHSRQNSIPSYGGHAQVSPQGQEMSSASEARMVPVVGSQGRRGILPSAPGRAPAVGSALDGTARGVVPPAKNAEGKYPCMYCNKTYLHLKHLKRHHLRRKSCSSHTIPLDLR